MVTLHLLPILQVLAILCTSYANAYPIYGTKRYGRSSSGHKVSNLSWGTPMQPYQQYLRTQRYPLNYYEMYPYNQEYADDYYYPQEALSYPVYYPPPRTSKYEVYQAVLPYYYGNRPVVHPGYGYYGYDKTAVDPVEDIEEEIQQEAEREERKDSQPIGQEVLYENDGSDEKLDDVNAAFLQNLIMSQMYKDAFNDQNNYYDQYNNADYYVDDESDGRWDDGAVEPSRSYQEDDDVRELKQLAKLQKPSNNFAERRPTAEERLQWFGRDATKSQGKNQKIYGGNKRSTAEIQNSNKKTEISEHGPYAYDGRADYDVGNRKVAVKSNAITSTTVAPKMIKNVRGGQKEEVLMRPATPARHPFTGSVLDMLSKDDTKRKRTPSVYDTIKHMLNLEKSLENNYDENEMKPQMRKRIISSEDTLTRQLSVLKKSP